MAEDDAEIDDERRQRFEQLFRDHYDAVLAYAAARADLATAKDATAATFLVAWRRHGEEQEHPRPWLYGVARRSLADQRRSARRMLALRQKLDVQTPRVAYSEGAVDPTLLAALETLRASDQELLRLSAWEELTPAEIAQVLGCTRRVAIVRLHRARRRLRDALVALEGPGPESRRDPLRARDANPQNHGCPNELTCPKEGTP